MTASERLRALHAKFLQEDGQSDPIYYRAAHDAGAALPLIADVVEAAEKYAEVIDMPLMDAVLKQLRDSLEKK